MTYYREGLRALEYQVDPHTFYRFLYCNPNALVMNLRQCKNPNARKMTRCQKIVGGGKRYPMNDVLYGGVKGTRILG